MARPGLKLSEIGEDAFVRSLLAGFRADGNLLVPPGDDCAAVDTGSARLLLLKTDCIVEGVHYLPATRPDHVGRKALARAISDIAAMGGTPQYALVTVFTPPDTPAEYWRGVYRGIRWLAHKFAVSLAGGETTSCPHRAVSICLTGTVHKNHILTRSGGIPGDVLLVTGRLGGSFRSGRHLTFTPRVEEGCRLAQRRSVHALMDLSDGLGADLPRLASASRTGWHIDASSLPVARGCSPNDALHDGEDYELLIAAGPGSVGRLLRDWKRRFPRVPLTPVGRLTEKPARKPAAGGFDHFRIASRSSSC